MEEKEKPHVWVLIREKWTNESRVIRTVRCFDYKPELPDPDSYMLMRVAIESDDPQRAMTLKVLGT